MKTIQIMIVFLTQFGVGLFVPVLSLFLLERGCNMQNLPVIIGIYSAVVIAAEVPSGIFADSHGRKRAYLVSSASTFCSFMIMFLSSSLPVLILGMVMLGVGAAFLSGSLDSLIIEDCIHRNGDAALPKAAGGLLIFQCGGIAAGALLCAVLTSVGNYLSLVIVRLSVLLMSTLLCAIFLRDGASDARKKTSFGEQMKTVASALKKHRVVQLVLLCIFGSSVSLFALETYWQPRFTGILTGRQSYMLGILCAVGYVGNMFGSFLATCMKLTDAQKRWRCYLLCTACLGCGLVALAFQSDIFGFMLCYVLIMTLLGIANVPEQTILNIQASNEIRASLLSTASLASKLSSIFSSMICTTLIIPVDVPGVWLFSGGFTILIAAIATLFLTVWKHKKYLL